MRVGVRKSDHSHGRRAETYPEPFAPIKRRCGPGRNSGFARLLEQPACLVLDRSTNIEIDSLQSRAVKIEKRFHQNAALGPMNFRLKAMACDPRKFRRVVIGDLIAADLHG